MKVHLVDGTYELFRMFYGPGGGHLAKADGREVDGTRRVVGSVLTMLEEGATHLGVATDHVIESFRNDLWPGYKTGEGIDPALRQQFDLLEEALGLAGVTVWPMVEVEADDAMGAAAAVADADERVEQVIICTPDKDLAQCVKGTRVVQLDRRQKKLIDEDGVWEKFGVAPASIPDWLGLVGDSADGFPGLAGWGAKSAAAVLAHYGHITEIPTAPGQWEVTVRSATKLAATLAENLDMALLFRRIATLELDTEVGVVDDWEYRGPQPGFEAMAAYLDAPHLWTRALRLQRV